MLVLYELISAFIIGSHLQRIRIGVEVVTGEGHQSIAARNFNISVSSAPTLVKDVDGNSIELFCSD